MRIIARSGFNATGPWNRLAKGNGISEFAAVKAYHSLLPGPAAHFWSSTAVVLLLAGSLLRAADATNKPLVFEKRTFAVAMRDGVKLGTDVYLPSTNGAFPTLLLRTPYNKGIATGIGEDGARHGFATVI